MIRGIGLDVCDISRMQEALSHPRFLTRVFSAREREYMNARGAGAAQTAAGMYAAKEAFLKARGTGIDTLDLARIEVEHDGRGQPRYCLPDALLPAGMSAYLSITHESGIAAAVCVLEQAGSE